MSRVIYFIKVNESGNGYVSPQPLGAIVEKRSFHPTITNLSDEEILLHTGYYPASGEALRPEWDITRLNLLDNKYDGKLPCLNSFAFISSALTSR
jgi:hypothetical protein